MKKLLAMLLAALMVLSGALALAEGDDALEAPETMGFTLTADYDVDREALANVLTAFGLPEEIMGLADTAAAVISEAGERMYVGGNGLEWALTLKGSDIVNLVAEPTDDGFALGSSLIPSYALTLSGDTVAALMNQLTEKLGGALEGVDIEAVTEALTGYFEAFIGTCTASVTMGDPEQGEYEVNGATYNTMVPVNVDVEAIAAASQTLVKQLNEDETVQAAIQSLQGAGVTVTLDEGEAVAEQVPTFDMQAYMNIDENGETDGTTDVVFTVTAPGETEPATTGDVLVADGAVTVTLDFVSAASQLTVAYAPAEDGFGARVDANVQGLYVGLDLSNAIGESVVFDANLYVLDAKKPLFSEHGEIVAGGELTLSATGEGKTEIAVETLMGESAEEAAQSLLGDVMQNGLGSVISSALEAMPEEISSLAGLFMGGATAEAEPAA